MCIRDRNKETVSANVTANINQTVESVQVIQNKTVAGYEADEDRAARMIQKSYRNRPQNKQKPKEKQKQAPPAMDPIKIIDTQPQLDIEDVDKNIPNFASPPTVKKIKIQEQQYEEIYEEIFDEDDELDKKKTKTKKGK
eukprot:TRINITY_DN4301_c0_g1_i10.p1 TRINITY_DN4301_c0_g1~~TRINITY_DN4301_c0_g1_i10.p1  ORF type:complete len:139 (+),score=37.07 TRINITY_DN4301_c0_g1_i10:65-481(+)